MQESRVFKLLEISSYLPKLPEDIGEILNILKDPIEADIDNLVEKVSKISELNELMLHNLNSGYFKLRKEITSIKEAIIYLGLRTVQNLLLFFITINLFPESMRKSNRKIKMMSYWKHVMGTSVASCMLAEKLKKGDKFKLFSYGLVHDIGIIVLDTCFPELVEKIIEKMYTGMDLTSSERIYLDNLTHGDIGARLCRRWNIREDITTIVEYHHFPFSACDSNEDLRIIYVADSISTEYCEKLLGIHIDRDINNQVIQSLGLTQNDVQEIIRAFPKEMKNEKYYIPVLRDYID